VVGRQFEGPLSSGDFRAQEDGVAVELQESLLLRPEPPNVQVAIYWHAHPLQGWTVGNGRHEQPTVAGKRDESAIEQMIDRGRQQEAVVAVKTLWVRTVAPWLAVAGSQVLWAIDSGHSALRLDCGDTTSKQALPTTS
jgi:hypothetical protein